MSEADNIALSLRAVAEHEDLTGTSFDIVNEAAATIAELEKRIGELESAWDQLTKRHAEALTDLAAERQRREEAEGALREVETAGDRYMARQSAAAYFSRYPSEAAPPSTTEAENE